MSSLTTNHCAAVKWASVGVTVAVVGVAVVHHLGNKPVPQAVRIARCTEESFSFSVLCPPGGYLCWLLEVPGKTATAHDPIPFQIAGRLTLRAQEEEPHELLITQGHTFPCNWLQMQTGNLAYFLADTQGGLPA